MTGDLSNETGIWIHAITVISLMTFKLSILFVGYLIAKLGHDLLVKGVTGEFKFQTQFKGSTADLVSASPGLFFILMATVLISIGIIKDKPLETTLTKKSISSSAEQATKAKEKEQKPELSIDPEEGKGNE